MLWPRRVWSMIVCKVKAQKGHFVGFMCIIWFLHSVSMERSWPLSDLRSPIKKFQDIQFVIGHGQTPHAKFRIHCSKTVGASEGQSWHVSTSVDLVWWPDLTWPRLENFTGVAKYTRRKLLKISRRYAPRFFRYLRKTSRGGWFQPPPATARVNEKPFPWKTIIFYDLWNQDYWP